MTSSIKHAAFHGLPLAGLASSTKRSPSQPPNGIYLEDLRGWLKSIGTTGFTMHLATTKAVVRCTATPTFWEMETWSASTPDFNNRVAL